jgi:outer membrane protein assembly factor BamD (BamD/ComL family)
VKHSAVDYYQKESHVFWSTQSYETDNTLCQMTLRMNQMKNTILFLIMLLCLSMSGCSDQRAKELYDTATLEERQASLDHARQLYKEIISKYPQTKYATEARKRLDALENK